MVVTFLQRRLVKAVPLATVPRLAPVEGLVACGGGVVAEGAVWGERRNVDKISTEREKERERRGERERGDRDNDRQTKQDKDTETE